MDRLIPLRFFANPNRGVPGLVLLPESGARRAAGEIAGWAGAATPLKAVPGGWVKDEGARFGLGVPEALGVAHAAGRLVVAALARRGVRATAEGLFAGGVPEAAVFGLTGEGDAGHRAALAWAAARMGLRGKEMLDLPALSREGVTEPVRDVMQGLRMAVGEALAAMEGRVTHLLAEGALLAAAASVEARSRLGREAPAIIVMEEGEAPWLRAAMGEGEPPCALAWQELERGAAGFLQVAREAGDGEGLGAVAAMLGEGSRVLMIGAAEAGVVRGKVS
ncbi:hypothetical protein IAI18_03515 [Acetobacteraceae bacterium H6797]|nr:hypothetical protein [Acetobacteraceae bacterium H6797]